MNNQMLYRITCEVTGEFYIGKTHCLPKRWWQHKWNARNGIETHLYRAMRLYGVDKFSIAVVDTTLTESELIARDKPHYNMTAGGDGGDTSTSPKFKSSMKAYHARKPREEYATYGMLGKKLTPEQCAKISKANSRSITIDAVEYPSRRAAWEALGISRSTFRRRYLV